jgi:hypothetical protein
LNAADNETEVETTRTLKIKANKELDETTLINDNIKVYKNGNLLDNYTLTKSGSDCIIGLGARGLSPLSTYRVTAGGIKGEAGQELISDVDTAFQTEGRVIFADDFSGASLRPEWNGGNGVTLNAVDQTLAGQSENNAAKNINLNVDAGSGFVLYSTVKFFSTGLSGVSARFMAIGGDGKSDSVFMKTGNFAQYGTGINETGFTSNPFSGLNPPITLNGAAIALNSAYDIKLIYGETDIKCYIKDAGADNYAYAGKTPIALASSSDSKTLRFEVANAEVSFDNVRITNHSPAPIEFIKDGQTAGGVSAGEITAQSGLDGTVILALYQGTLDNSVLADINIGENGSASVTVPSGGTYFLKAFVWDGLDAMLPACQAETLQ